VKELVRFVVNGDPVEVAVEAGTTLLECLREELALTGSKQGCDKGDCGACTVLLDGRAVLACITLAHAVAGREVTTIEGLAEAGRLHPLQEAFDTEGAAQCGFCTPGMIMSAAALVEENVQPTRDEVREALSGNLCRCTGYTKILDAVAKAAGELQAARGAPGTGRGR
jgi:carbon-monoxide dehydrogenase small subunit